MATSAREGHDMIICPCCGKPKRPEGFEDFGTALKPAIELIALARKPLSESTIAKNIARWGTGAINVGATKIPANSADIAAAAVPERGNLRMFVSDGSGRADTKYDMASGRWPANLIHDGSEEVLACFPETTSGDHKQYAQNIKGWKNSCDINTFENNGDSGSAARFFASFPQDGNGRDGEVSASRRYADRGATTFTQTPGRRQEPVPANRLFYTSKADTDDRLGSSHPTVKPIDLLQYLVRLITPPNGICLDLFAGTGTTAEAAFREGFRSILIEREAEYIKDIERRMALVMEGPVTRAHAGIKARGRPVDDGPLFGGSSEPLRRPRPTGCIMAGDEGPFGYDGGDKP